MSRGKMMITNYLSPLEFQVTIQKLENVEFFIQKVSIPSISMAPVIVPTPFNNTYATPDKLTYSEMSLSFIIDEGMRNYLEVFNWMISISAPQDFKQYRGLPEDKRDIYSDMSIIMLNSNKNPSIRFNFKNCFPISLSEVSLDTTQQDLQYPEATVSFQYDYFDIDILR